MSMQYQFQNKFQQKLQNTQGNLILDKKMLR